MKKIAIIQRTLPHYRVPFFSRLRKELLNKNIELKLIYGQASLGEENKSDSGELSWGFKIKNMYFPFRFVWQPCVPEILNADLVIIEQANRLLINYYLIIQKIFANKKIAYWGHGRNLQSNEKSITNILKKFFINCCNWWFAYTGGTKRYLIKNGYNEGKITVVNNAIDIEELILIKNNIERKEIENIKKELGIIEGNIGVYCGGIYKEKRMEFLIKSCYKIKNEVKNFHLIVIGSGPDKDIIEKETFKNKWIYYLGPQFGKKKVISFLLSDILLIPGAVGLVVLDSFALGVPIATTNYAYHGPEIEYIKNNENGFIFDNDINSYANGVVEVLKNKTLLKQVKENALISARIYTLDTMVDNFYSGIIRCLNQ